ncbi:MAG: hypothetical protein ACREBF_03600 [Candidatus Micrarchaeales archaeon]
MPLYIKLEQKRNTSHFDRVSNTLNLFNSIFNFLKMNDDISKVTLFEVDPFSTMNKNLEGIPLSLSSEKLRSKVESSKVKDDLGIEIDSIIHFDKGAVPVIFTLLPRNRSLHYDILLEILPNGYVNRFMDIEKHIKEFRGSLVESIKKYNTAITEVKDKKSLLRINKAFISIENEDSHGVINYELFYSREPNDFINELFSLVSDKAKERITFANREKVATTLIENISAFSAINRIAKSNNITISGGSITVIPKDKDSMKNFTTDVSKLIENFVIDVYPDKEEYDKKLYDAFTKV